MFKKIMCVFVLVTTPYVWGMHRVSFRQQKEEARQQAVVERQQRKKFLKPYFDLLTRKEVILPHIADVQFDPDGHMYILSYENHLLMGEKTHLHGVYEMLIHPKAPLVYVLMSGQSFAQGYSAFIYSLGDLLPKKELFVEKVKAIAINSVTDHVYVVHVDGRVTIHASDGKPLNEHPSAQNVRDICVNQNTGQVYVLHNYTDADGGFVTVYEQDNCELSGGIPFAKNVFRIYSNPNTGHVYVLHDGVQDSSLITAYTCDGEMLNKAFAKNVYSISVDPKTGKVYVLHDYIQVDSHLYYQQISYKKGACVTVYTSEGEMLHQLFQGAVENIFFSPNGDVLVLHKNWVSSASDDKLYRYTWTPVPYQKYFQKYDASVEC